MNWKDHKLALAVAVPVAVVAVIAGIVSYGHIEGLALSVHQTISQARLLPFAVDFLIVAGSVVLLAGYWLGWLCVITGVAGTLFANIESGLPYGPLAATVAAWPAVAFTVASFVLERWLRRQARLARPEPVPAAVPVPEPVQSQPVPQPRPEPVPEPRPYREPVPEPAEPYTEPEPVPMALALVPQDQSQEEAARKAYLDSVKAGQPLSDRALGARFSKSRTWGATRIREAGLWYERGDKLEPP